MDNEINGDRLDELFNLNKDVIPDQEIFFSDIPVNEEEDIIRKNIERANRMLDRVEDEMQLNPRVVEVFAKLVDSVTNAASQIQSSTYNTDYLILRQKLAQLKEMEVKAKVKSLASGPKNQTIGSQNIILTDRESILNIMKGGSIKELEE